MGKCLSPPELRVTLALHLCTQVGFLKGVWVEPRLRAAPFTSPGPRVRELCQVDPVGSHPRHPGWAGLLPHARGSSPGAPPRGLPLASLISPTHYPLLLVSLAENPRVTLLPRVRVQDLGDRGTPSRRWVQDRAPKALRQ